MQDYAHDHDIVLSWPQPAQAWTEAMPVGNGRLGAMIFGGLDRCRVQVNDSTVWSGHPGQPAEHLKQVVDGGAGPHRLEAVRQAIDAGNYSAADELIKTFQGPYSQEYLPFADLHITSPGLGRAQYLGRTLNLSSGVAEELIQAGPATVRRRMWASWPAGALIIEIDVTGGALSSQVSLDSPLPVTDRHSSAAHLGIGVDLPVDGAPLHEPRVTPAWTYLSVPSGDGYDPYATAQLAIRTDGEAVAAGDRVDIRGYRQLLLVLASSTSPGVEWSSRLGRGSGRLDREAHRRVALEHAQAVAQSPAGQLLAAHTVQSRRQLDASSVRIGRSAPPVVPVAELLTPDRDEGLLLSTVFQFGRYLLASASQPEAGPPANLQGLWNDQLRPPWSSSYTNDINIEMNYWAAETTGLSACQDLLFDLVDVARPNGTEVARQLYGADGWVLHSNTDLWGWALPAGMGHGDPGWAAFTGGGAWLATHFWERFAHTQDLAFLSERALPVLAGAVKFYLSFAVPGRDGGLDVFPSMSPENKFIAADGTRQSLGRSTAVDLALMTSVCQSYLEAVAILGVPEPDPPVSQVADAVRRLPAFQISPEGWLQEWDRPVPEADPHHRHISPLIAVYPLGLIDPETTPALAEAAAKLLDRRGDGAMGWSWVWKAACRARLGQAEDARRLLLQAMQPLAGDSEVSAPLDGSRWGGLLPNLFSSHPPFQMDGNFGFPAAIVEMLVQGHHDKIRLLPARPDAWTEIKVRGIHVRGGLCVDLTVESGSLTHVMVRRDAGRDDIPVALSCGSRKVEVRVPLGVEVDLDGDLALTAKAGTAR